MRVRFSTVAVAAALGLLAIHTIVGAHNGNDDPDVIHACVNNASKSVRIVGVSGSCTPAETPAHWAVQGPPGPPGTNGTNGIDGINGTNGTNGLDATRPDGPCFNGSSRYVDCGNGTVTDTVTGLIWLQRADCFRGSSDWIAANHSIAAHVANGVCGLTDRSSVGDWRLPTKDEWSAMIAPGCTGSAAPSLTNDSGSACYGDGSGSSFMFVESANYWSSTSLVTDPSLAWKADLSLGDVMFDTKHRRGNGWPVRGPR